MAEALGDALERQEREQEQRRQQQQRAVVSALEELSSFLHCCGFENPSEGLASHTGSESCGHGRKAGYEALTGGTTGQVIEPRNTPNFRTPTP